MLDAAPVAMQRARGRAAVTLGLSRGATRIERLHQSGSAKAFLPNVHGPIPEVVFLNTAGGLTGGDRFGYSARLGEGASATLTTQTAERAYRSAAGAAEMTVELEAGAGATLHWLPQETILFEGAALDRRTTVALHGDARLLMVESLVLGRAAMGETVTALDLSDRRTITRDGVPVLIEPLRLTSGVLARRSPATLGQARAMATVILAAQGAEDALAPVRAALSEPGTEAAASAWDGRLVVRALASDGWPLRRLVARVLTLLRGGALPRVWQV
ncbi:MAG: urease accessory protein UreD [Rhodobacteraceae bacterium]|jgi:urease accessory protein|nr:urease accessory protein UreD [Paracoccaceae bacterium]